MGVFGRVGWEVEDTVVELEKEEAEEGILGFKN